jgi:hypothetical protein
MRAWTTALFVIVLAAGAPPAGAECRPSDATERVRVTLTPPEGLEIAGAVVTLAYPADKLVIEGRGREAAQGAVGAFPEGTVTVAEDHDGELRLVIAKAKALKVAPLFEATFHRCEGGKAPAIAELSCRVTDASDPVTGKIKDVRCSVSTAS